jgi:hypothetical protein
MRGMAMDNGFVEEEMVDDVQKESKEMARRKKDPGHLQGRGIPVCSAGKRS